MDDARVLLPTGEPFAAVFSSTVRSDDLDWTSRLGLDFLTELDDVYGSFIFLLQEFDICEFTGVILQQRVKAMTIVSVYVHNTHITMDKIADLRCFFMTSTREGETMHLPIRAPITWFRAELFSIQTNALNCLKINRPSYVVEIGVSKPLV